MTRPQSFALKSVGELKLLYVMAADVEYGPHLQARISPLITGIGPVEAGVGLAACLSALSAQNNRPDWVVALGSAGSPSLDYTKVYQAHTLSYRDMDASALGFEKGQTPFLDLPPQIRLTYQVPDIPGAALSSGANVVTGAGYAGLDADMVDMESFAYLRAAHKFDIPLIALRGISDGKQALTQLADWTKYLHIIDEKLAEAVDSAEAALANSRLEI